MGCGEWNPDTSCVGAEPEAGRRAQGRAGAKQTGGPAMAGTKPLTAYWMHDVIRISEPSGHRKARMAAGTVPRP